MSPPKKGRHKIARDLEIDLDAVNLKKAKQLLCKIFACTDKKKTP